MAFFAVKNFRNKTEVVSLYQSSKKSAIVHINQ